MRDKTVYHYGGPYVDFFLETYGGAKFLELYRSVRRPTFYDDFEQIMGKPFDEVESEFWSWYRKLNPEVNTPTLSQPPPSQLTASPSKSGMFTAKGIASESSISQTFGRSPLSLP